MRIQLSGLSTEPQIFEHKCPAEYYIDDRDTFQEDIKIRVTLAREGNSLHLALEAELPGCFICDRCGIAFKRLHLCQGDFYFTFEKTGATLKSQDVTIIPVGAFNLDISQEIRDLIILGLPSQAICGEDCQGLCPRCGVNLNNQKCTCQQESFDTRWEALKNLKKKSTSKTQI